MPTPYDVPAPSLIERLTRYLNEEVDEIIPPDWAQFAKTGSHTQRPPQNPNWWAIRCASLLRKIYLKGPIGIERLRSEYGGRIDKGTRPEHARKSGGSIIRKALQQLQSAGLVEPSRNKGKVMTSEGRRLLDRLSTAVKTELEKTQPNLKKY